MVNCGDSKSHYNSCVIQINIGVLFLQKANHSLFEKKINTNATFLTEKICHGIFKNNITQVVISSDHYIKEDYERLRLKANS